jgi:hypothetical protein
VSAAEARVQPAPERQGEGETEPVTLVGYIDAVVDGRVFGWAWDPKASGTPVTIRLLAGDRLLAETLADRKREDLAANGVGDGAHAFEARVPEGVAAEDLRVVAVCPRSGATIALDKPPPAAVPGQADEQVRAAMTTLWRGMRVLHQEMERLKSDAGAQDSKPDGDAFAARLDALEAAVFRIDQSLATRERGAAPAAPDLIARVLAGFAAFAGLAALVAAMVR